jgi:hypothetical protein
MRTTGGLVVVLLGIVRASDPNAVQCIREFDAVIAATDAMDAQYGEIISAVTRSCAKKNFGGLNSELCGRSLPRLRQTMIVTFDTVDALSDAEMTLAHLHRVNDAFIVAHRKIVDFVSDIDRQLRESSRASEHAILFPRVFNTTIWSSGMRTITESLGHCASLVVIPTTTTVPPGPGLDADETVVYFRVAALITALVYSIMQYRAYASI